MTEPVVFWTSDSWLLLSIAVAAGGRETGLSSVLAVGREIDRTVFTPRSLRLGTARLVAGGLARYAEGRYCLTEAGLCLYDTTTGPPMARWRQLSELLGAVPGPADGEQLEDECDPFPGLTDGVIESAVRELGGRGGAMDGGETDADT